MTTAPTDAAPRPGHGDEVLYERTGSLGRVLLNRPRAINSLTTPMVASLRDQLTEWADDDAVTAVSIEGLGEKGLCAGGDMRAVRESALDAGEAALDFFRTEYAVNSLLGGYPKPVVAFMDGVVMGGGVGLSGHDGVRLATARTRLAMPETAIGFFCDVGGAHLLAAAPGEVGAYLAMTGEHIGGGDAVHAGFADAVIDADEWGSVLARLAAGEQVAPAPNDTGSDCDLAGRRVWIDECFTGTDPVEILHRLEEHPQEAARGCAATIRSRSPLSVCVVLEQVRRAVGASLDDVLAQDLVLAARFVARSDMPEGVRDVLVDKGRGTPPRWLYPRVEDVPRDVVEDMFRPL